jgi:hypothetical protein
MISLPEKHESFQSLLLDLHLVHSEHLVNSLYLLLCQFLLRLFLATFLCCYFWTFFGMLGRQMPVPAHWCIVAPGSKICFFLILYSMGWLCMLMLD